VLTQTPARMDIVGVLAVAFWAMLPAYVPNNAAVLVGGGPPIDGGRTWNGRRVLGDGKTWLGTVGGIAAGAALALLLNAIRPVVSGAVAGLPEFTLVAAITLPAGALLGDIAASFLKRRTGRERGAAFPGVDQLDFVVGALGLTVLLAPDWFFETFTLPVLAVVLVITPVLHVGTNLVAYKLSLKSEPW
jgi:CDP-2,3-bis-(O-geranylgeranyl)-sn-glycerol synthase